MAKNGKFSVSMLLMVVMCLISMLCGCGVSEQAPSNVSAVNNRRGFEGDVCPAEHSAPYCGLFLEDYPNMEITKIRWQTLHTGEETYIVEGVKDNKKCIVKYLMGDSMILGRVERELLEEEIQDGKCIEKPLDFDAMLTITELSEIAVNELGGEMQELRISWKKDVPLAYAEVRDESTHAKGVMLNALTGEILF